MSALTDQFDSDFAGMISDLSASATWSGNTLTGIFTDLSKGDRPEVGGFVFDYDASFHARASQLPTIKPNTGSIFVIDTKRYVVDRIVITPDGVEWQFQLKSDHR
jgi:hypothetical protein